MAIPIYSRTYTDKYGAVHYRYYTPTVGKTYASGSFQIRTSKGDVEYTEEQAKEVAAKQAAQYLNLPLYEFEGYEQAAPSPEIVGQATQAREEQAAESRARRAALQAKREELKSGYSGEFKSEYSQRLAAAPIETPVPTQQEFMKVQALRTGQATFSSEAEFQDIAGKLSKFGEFAGATEFKGQIIQPPVATPEPSKPPVPGVPSYLPQDQRPFAGFKRPEPLEKSPYAGLTLSPAYQRLAGISRDAQSGVESIIGYSEKSHPIVKAASGFSSVFTGLPEYFGGAALGAEYTIRNPPKDTLTRVSPVFAAVPGAMKTGGQIAAQIKEKPFESIGVGVGLLALGKAPKVINSVSKGIKDLPSGTKSLIKSTKAEVSIGYDIRSAMSKAASEGRLKHAELPIQKIESPYALQPLPQKAVKTKVATLGREGYLPTKSEFLTESLSKLRVQEQPRVLPGLEKLEVMPATARPKTITAFKPVAIPRFLTHQKVRTIPATQTKVNVLQQTKLKSKTVVLPAVKIRTKTVTYPATATKLNLMPAVKTRVQIKPAVLPAVKTQPAVKVMPETATATQTKVKTSTATQTATATRIITKINQRQKIKTPSLSTTTKTGKRKGFGKYGEISRIATPKQILRGLK